MKTKVVYDVYNELGGFVDRKEYHHQAYELVSSAVRLGKEWYMVTAEVPDLNASGDEVNCLAVIMEGYGVKCRDVGSLIKFMQDVEAYIRNEKNRSFAEGLQTGMKKLDLI